MDFEDIKTKYTVIRKRVCKSSNSKNGLVLVNVLKLVQW